MATELATPNRYIVYKHTFPNSKVYIGITRNKPYIRWNNGNGYRDCRLMYRAIKKYGWENVSHEILLSNLSFEDACEKEKELIKEYNSNNPKHGYNIDSGGNASDKISDETKKRMSEAHKRMCENPAHIEELRERGRKSRLGKTVSQSTREKIGLKNRQSLARPIAQYDMFGNLIQTYSSAGDAAKKLNITKSDICRAAKGERKTCHKSIWRYL